MTKQRVRAQDESLAHLSFLFKEYRTPCLYMEPLELLRRAFMIGLVGFCGEHAPTKSAAGVLVALLFVFVYRELSPFSDRLNSLLADVSMWMTFWSFYARSSSRRACSDTTTTRSARCCSYSSSLSSGSRSGARFTTVRAGGDSTAAVRVGLP